MKAPFPFCMTLIATLLVSSCASNNNEPVSLESYLKDNSENSTDISFTDDKGLEKAEYGQELSKKGLTFLSNIDNRVKSQKSVQDLSLNFDDENTIQFTADELPLKDYLHHVLGELLGVNYILGEDVKVDQNAVTMNFQDKVSERRLFAVSQEILSERGYVVRYDNGLYYIHKSDNVGAQGSVAYGYGQAIENVPDTNATIVQLVPLKYGLQTSLANSLRQIVNIKATPDFERGSLVLQGKRNDVIKALEFIQLMDQPAFKERHIAIYRTTYISTDELKKKLPELMKQEGISVDTQGLSDKAVSLVTLDSIGMVALFANQKSLIERAYFWASEIDKAPSGNHLQYFLYSPKYARAADLGESLQLLVDGGSSAGVGSKTSAASQNKAARSSGKSAVSSNGELSLVVDERANSIIVHATGDKYRQLLPLIKRLDVMPKQVLLEVMIAEVKLTSGYKQGVDFELTNQGDATKVGGFNLGADKTGLSYVLTGTRGSLNISLLQSNGNVNVISRPSLLVRDGIKATINVGDEVPTVGDIVTDPTNGSRTSVVYKKTGVDLQVKPTINARGVVIMEIAQKITTQGSAGVSGSPSFFERSISTEVVAESGETILLGGLISENKEISGTSVPFFSSIPVLGNLFDSQNDTQDKTELVVLVTPKVVESTEQWGEIKAKFAKSLSKLNINQ